MVNLFVYLCILCWMQSDIQAYPNRRFAGLVVVRVLAYCQTLSGEFSSVSNLCCVEINKRNFAFSDSFSLRHQTDQI